LGTETATVQGHGKRGERGESTAKGAETKETLSWGQVAWKCRVIHIVIVIIAGGLWPWQQLCLYLCLYLNLYLFLYLPLHLQLYVYDCESFCAHQSVVTVSANVTDTSGISDKDKAMGGMWI